MCAFEGKILTKYGSLKPDGRLWYENCQQSFNIEQKSLKRKFTGLQWVQYIKQSINSSIEYTFLPIEPVQTEFTSIRAICL